MLTSIWKDFSNPLTNFDQIPRNAQEELKFPCGNSLYDIILYCLITFLLEFKKEKLYSLDIFEHHFMNIMPRLEFCFFSRIFPGETAFSKRSMSKRSCLSFTDVMHYYNS